MIVPMKKISLFILGDKKSEALKKLRALGLLQIEISEGSGEKLAELKEDISVIQSALFSIKEKAPKKAPKQKTDFCESPLLIAKEVLSLNDQKKAIENALSRDKAELERIKALGEVNMEDISFLKQKGFDVSLYEMPKKEYEKIGSKAKTISFGRDKKIVRFLLAFAENEDKEALISYKTELPEISTVCLRERIEKAKKEIDELNVKLASYCVYTDSLNEAVKNAEKEIEFEILNSGMQKSNISEKEDTSVAYFKGFIEAEKLDTLKQSARENAWGLISEDPSEEDNVPTKLKNNRFVSLIYPLTDFLGTVPGYFEYDISAFFLGFILIFFGIIFGDGGYGLLILSVAAIPIIKALIAKKKIEPAFLLLALFGLSTVIWGTLTCTWVGLSPDKLPQFLKSLSIPLISNVYANKLWQPFWVSGNVGLTTAQNLQIFCFSLALIQLSIAHIKGAIRYRKSLKMLSDIGNILQLLGIYYVVLSLVVNPQVFSLSLVLGGIPIGTLSIALIGIGFALSFVFANYEGSIVKSLLASLTNIVSVLLGVVNVFSDIVSYIRLWAVGLAGAAISATVNELAGPLLGNFLFMIIAIVLLIFGHGLNMILNVLSVIVHGIRLNTLEFSSHLDMSWSGHKFKPFKE